jgi:Mg-chelatase subunit ChlD
MELPSCEDIEYELFAMSYPERRELISKLLEKGPQAIDDFIKEQESGDKEIAKYIKKVRKMLERQAAKIREARSQRHLKKMRTLEKRRDQTIKTISTQEEKISQEQEILQARLDQILADAILTEDMVQEILGVEQKPDKKPSFLKRFLRAIARFFISIGRGIKRFFRWIGRKLGLVKEKKIPSTSPSLVISFPSLAGIFRDIDSKFGNALIESPKIRKEAERKLYKKSLLNRARLSWRRRFHREKYISDLKRSFYRNLENDLNKKIKKTEERRKALEGKSKSLKMRRVKARKDTKKRVRDLKKKDEQEEREMQRQLKEKPRELAKKRITESFQDAGLLSYEDSKLTITSKLVDRFADIVFSSEMENLPTSYHALFGASDSEGLYERGGLRTIHELSRMDIVGSVVNARIHHPRDKHMYEDDVVVYRDLKGANNHVVLMFDKSGSMDENKRIQAAKKAVLALYKGIKKRNSRNIVDLVAFDTRVEVIDLLEVWQSEPQGFTNTGEAIKVAGALLKDSHADRKMVYLITDGLPEAYTDDGEEYVGDTDKSLSYATSQAKELGMTPNIQFTLILLEPREKMYVNAAQKITDAINGKTVVVEPEELASELLMDFVTA